MKIGHVSVSKIDGQDAVNEPLDLALPFQSGNGALLAGVAHALGTVTMGFAAAVFFPPFGSKAKTFVLERIGDSLGVVEELAATKGSGLALVFVPGRIVPESLELRREAPEGHVPEDAGKSFYLADSSSEDNFLGQAGVPGIALAVGRMDIAVQFVAVIVSVNHRADNNLLPVGIAGRHPAKIIESLLEGVKVGRDVLRIDVNKVRDQGVKFVTMNEFVKGHCAVRLILR